MTDHVRYIRSPFTLYVLFSLLTYCRCFTHGSVDIHDGKGRKKKETQKKWRRKNTLFVEPMKKKKTRDSQCGKKALRVCKTIVFLCTKSVVNQTQLCVCVLFFCLYPLFAKKKEQKKGTEQTRKQTKQTKTIIRKYI